MFSCRKSLKVHMVIILETQLQRGDRDGVNKDRVDEEDMADKEDRADEVQAEEDEGELVGMGNTLRIQTLYYKVKAPG